uniref:Glycylpeptide N-tetradecanoyltransferase n=1 Tax=Chromulina nebulosa TaxID=96789 RepID=A0A7S0SQ60_9STRA
MSSDDMNTEGYNESSVSSSSSSNRAATTSNGITTGSSTTNNTSLSGNQILNYIKDLGVNLDKQAKREAKMTGVDNKEHKFWNTQPVIQSFQEPIHQNGPIEIKSVDEIRKEPYNMPTGFEWCIININDPEEIKEMYTLLSENYVEDDDCQFRFDYSIPFLQWALTPPGFKLDWHVGVRNQKTKKLMGCITAIPAVVKVYDTAVNMVEINFLCVHKKLRDKRLAPVLIKEITRRVNLHDVWQAAYTAGVVLPKPVSRCRYYHRSLNPKKLIEAKFSYLPQRTTMASHIRTLKLKPKPDHNLIPLQHELVPSAHKLLTEYLESNTKLRMIFSIEEFAHVFLPRDTVVSTFVIVDNDNNVTDLCSFYFLPSTIIGNPLHNKLSAVYSYYNVATTISFESLMKDALILARNQGADVFNALDVMENLQIMDSLKFGIGDGYLQYYLYNWQCSDMNAEDIGLVLL